MGIKKTASVSTLDPLHPLIRRLLRTVQVRDLCVSANPEGARDSRLAHVGALLVDVAQHIATARPRVEHDEAAQLRIECDGAPIGTLRRPATVRDLLHPALEAAITRQLEGDDGAEGDADAAAECADVDTCATVIL